MVLFLTSSPLGDLDGRYQVEGVDNRNGFLDELRVRWRENCRCLIISAAPDEYDRNEEFQSFLRHAFEVSGLSVASVDLLDRRWEHISQEELCSYDLIVLGGGHVPTQNAFFHRIHLRDKIQNYQGIVIGISAGTMNCADLVYAQPEEEGEALNPDYRRFLPGLGLTDINVLPHYQMLKDSYLDGMRLFEDITVGDSQGRKFIALIDGSYIMVEEQGISIRGEAYYVRPQGIEKIQDSYKI